MVRQTFGMDAEVELGPVLQLPQPALVQQDLSDARPKDKSLSQRASLSDQHHQDDSGHRDVDRSASSRPLEPLDGPMDIEVLPGLTDPPPPPPMNKYRFAAVCTQTLLAGLTDSAPGALIPYLETYYNIGYAVVSLIFISNAVGFIVAAPVIAALQARLGRSRTLALGDLLIVAGFVPLIVAAPFPAIVAGYLVIGFGFALNLSISNVFTANMRNGTTLLGLMHGSYGLGGIVGPLVATSIVSTAGSEAWHRFYYITVALALFNGCFFYWSFRDYEGESISNGDHTQLQPQGTATAMASTPPGAKEHVTNMLQALGSRIMLLGAIFIFAYQGAEVSISGWVISFLITFRGGDPHSVGNVTSGFWGGITLGRLILSPLGARVGEKRFVYFITVGAAVFQLLIWFVPNIISNAVSLAIAGLLLGPVYPCAATVLARSLTRREQDSGLAVVWAFGSSGGAVAPFLTGLLAQAVGTFVLHPIVLALYAVMVLCWFLLPALRKRTE